jgi:hypothetical protein
MGTPLSGPMPFPQFSGETRGAVPSGMYSSGTDLINPMGLNTSIVNSSYNHFGGVISNQLGVPSDSLPEIDVVSPTLRRDIILGKDINMSSLLISGYKSEQMSCTHFLYGSEVIQLKNAPDSRLNRQLSLSEFIMAFAIYKNVMCEAYPQRRHELDTYERHIVEIAHKFMGSSFYEHRKAFSARAPAMLLNYNITR